MRDKFTWACHFAALAFDLGNMTLTLCVSSGDGSTHVGAFADFPSFVSFLVSISPL